MRWVAIQRNPTSGAGRQYGPLRELIARLRAHGIRPRLYSRRDELDAAVTDRAQRENLVAIVAAGGDGTLLDVLNRHSDLPIALLPLGTENLVARYFRIPRDGARVADIIAEGHIECLDVGRVNQRRFVVMASVGFDAEVVRRTHSRRRGHISQGSYLRPIFGALREYMHPVLRISIDDDPTPLQARLVVVANLPAYALGLHVVPSAAGNDGFLDVRAFEQGSAYSMMRYLFAIGCRRHEGLPDVVLRRAQRIRIESDEPVPVQIDGDPAGCTPLTIELERALLRLIIPRERAAALTEPPITR